MKIFLFIKFAALACILLATHNAAAGVIAFEVLPISSPPDISHSGVGDSVLADHFATASSGIETGIESWNASPPTGGAGSWVMSLRDDTGGKPAAAAPTDVISREPGTVALIAVGLLVLVIVLRRHYDEL